MGDGEDEKERARTSTKEGVFRPNERARGSAAAPTVARGSRESGAQPPDSEEAYGVLSFSELRLVSTGGGVPVQIFGCNTWRIPLCVAGEATVSQPGQDGAGWAR